ncbi:MAG: hypothetical protein ACOC1U_03075 [Spirochaetota bacterium]
MVVMLSLLVLTLFLGPSEPAAAQPWAGYAPRTGLPLNAWLTLAGVATAPLSFDKEGVGFAYTSELFDVGFDFVLNNDQKYTPSELHMRGRYFDLIDGRVAIRGSGITATGGRILHRDEVPGPYSLFISSAPNPTTVLDLRLDTGFFFYNTRWLELNRRSSLYSYDRPVLDSTGTPTDRFIREPLDRGAVYKVYGVDFGRLTVGLQESVVYLYTSFYPEYFLSPMPMYFTQLVNSTFGKPWTQVANENSLMGIYGTYEWDNASVFGQFLIDDWNEMGIDWLGVGEWNNPAKFAWSIGGTLELDAGTLGLYQAGATKYTFEPTYGEPGDYNRYPYSYTYYPVSSYATRDYGTLPILPEDNYIGYLHGENNIAFMGTFASEAREVEYEASLEYTISGSKAPTNPWHEDYWHFQQGTRLLDEPTLEHKLLVRTDAHRWFGPLRVQGDLALGGVWNELELVPVPGAPEESGVFRPSSSNRFLWRLGLEVRYVLGFEPGDAAPEER